MGDGLREKPKDLSGSEREESGDGKSVSMGHVRESGLSTYDVVCSQKTTVYVIQQKAPHPTMAFLP